MILTLKNCNEQKMKLFKKKYFITNETAANLIAKKAMYLKMTTVHNIYLCCNPTSPPEKRHLREGYKNDFKRKSFLKR